MFLAIDVGNSSTELGFFEGDQLMYAYRMKSDTSRSKDDYALNVELFVKSKGICGVSEILISSVVPSFNNIIEGICQDVFHLCPNFIGPKYPSGIRVNSDNPKEVGADLICDCAAARYLFGEDAIIADLGTASKLILCKADGTFEGCTIAPGIGISLNALVGNAALLSEVDIKIPKHHLGKNTQDSINSALTYGHAHGLIELANDIEHDYKKPLKRIISGGFARILHPLMGEFTYVENLTLLGIYAIYERNNHHD